MSDIDPLVSNGTCYYKPNSPASNNFVSCGNAGLPGRHFACCGLGDNCDSSGACYNTGADTVYLAGCTDPSFDAGECTNKGEYADQQWVGLVRCFRSNSDQVQIDTWAGCSEPMIDQITSVNPDCQCSSQTPLFTGKATLINIAVAPMSSGGTLSFFPGQTPPTFTSISSSTFISSSISATTDSSHSDQSTSDVTSSATLPPPSFSSASPPSSTAATAAADNELPTRVKIGVGVGVAVAALLVCCMVFMALLIRKRRQRGNNQETSSTPQYAQTASGSSWRADENNPTSSSYSGFKAELAADGLPSGEASVSPVSPQPQLRRQFEAYNPERHGNYARYSTISELYDPHRESSQGSASYVSPQHSETSHDQQKEGHEETPKLPMEPIWELQA